MRSALYEVSVLDGAAHPIALAARDRQGTQTVAKIGANGTGVPRTDLIYAMVTRTASAGAARKVKSVTGEITSPALTVETKPTVSYVIAAGTTAAPADTSTAWNLPLATITVPAGYTEGTVILVSQITQVWLRSFVPASAVRSVFGAAFGASGVGVPGVLEPLAPEPDWSRFGSERTFVTAFTHKANGAGTAFLADRFGNLAWINRIVRFSMIRAVSHAGVYPAPAGVTLPGASVSESSGWLFVGTSNGTIWTSARGFVLSLDGGYLKVGKPAGTAADDVTNGDNWLLIVETMDRFI